LDPKSLYFFHIGQLSTSALSNCFITIKAVTEKKYPNVQYSIHTGDI